MNSIVSDTGPLITWSLVSQMPLLKKVHPDIVVPDAVAAELRSPLQPLRPGYDLLERGWIRKSELDTRGDTSFPRWLGLGEKAAIVLALRMDSVLLIDDWEARNLARARGLRTTATLQTLERCKELGLLPVVEPLLKEMMAKGFRLAGDIRDRFLKQIGER